MDLYIDEKDKELGRARLSQGGEGASAGGPVSYTHLTLPTIYSV